MRTYELDACVSRNRGALGMNQLWDGAGYGASTFERCRLLIVLFQFLGAYQLAECLRCRDRGGIGMFGLGCNRVSSEPVSIGSP